MLLRVLSLYPRSHPAHDLPWNGADRGGHLAGVDAIVALLAQDHRIVSRKDLESSDVDGQHVHADRADHRGPAAANEHGTATGKTQIEAVRVAGGNDRNCDRIVGGEPRAVAANLARPH